MSVHGTNSPRPKPVFSTSASSRDLSSIFSPSGAGTGHSRPELGDVSNEIPRATLSARAASGIQSYWLGDAPAPIRMSGARLARLAAKRTLDIIGALLVLLFLMPLLIVVAIAIKVSDPGPALFKQARLGKDGRPFTIFKFRSMYMNKCSADGVAQTTSEDPRVMPLGAFIRRTSIDELPQLLNVLIGDMSLVGPRPHVEGQLAAGQRFNEVLPYYDYRLIMRPGLTGWAQANGFRGPTDNMSRARLRIEHDVAYIQNFSFMLDLKIMLRTLRREFIGGTGF